MATTTTTSSFVLQSTAPAVSARHLPSPRRRRIPPQAGRALEMLGHAIEYLADEYVEHGGDLSGDDAQVQAMQLLMSLNREIYYECPVMPTFGELCMALLRRLWR
jgi:hypothetical protein